MRMQKPQTEQASRQANGAPPAAFITGATGFIGGALAAHLHQRGWQVTAGVRPGSEDKLPARPPFGVCIAPLDAIPPRVLQGRVVFHAAAIRNRWGTPPSRYHQVNVLGTQAVLRAAIQGRARRFVYISSVGVYGWPGLAMMDEDTPLDASPAASPYHRSKIAAEQVVRAFAGDLETVIVRPTITCGPGDRDGMLTRLLSMLACGRFIPIGRGRNTIHLTDIADLCRGLELAGTHPLAAGETFILSGARPVQMRTLLAKACALLDRPLPPLFIPTPLALAVGVGMRACYRALHLPGEPLVTPEKVYNLTVRRAFSHRKAAQRLGYTPEISLDAMLRRTLAWMREENLLHH